MPVAFACPQCSHQGNVPDEFVGKTIRCKKCGATTTVPDVAMMARPKPPPMRPAQQHLCGVCGSELPGVGVACVRCREELLVPAVQPAEPTKACPYCGERILAVAVKCKHCGEMLDRAMRAAEENRRLSALAQARKATNVAVENTATATAINNLNNSLGCGCFLLGLALFFLFLVVFS